MKRWKVYKRNFKGPWGRKGKSIWKKTNEELHEYIKEETDIVFKLSRRKRKDIVLRNLEFGVAQRELIYV